MAAGLADPATREQVTRQNIVDLAGRHGLCCVGVWGEAARVDRVKNGDRLCTD